MDKGLFVCFNAELTQAVMEAEKPTTCLFILFMPLMDWVRPTTLVRPHHYQSTDSNAHLFQRFPGKHTQK